MSDIKISNESFNDILVCPKCGGSNLHQRKVIVYSRTKENGVGVCVETHLGQVCVSRIGGYDGIIVRAEKDKLCQYTTPTKAGLSNRDSLEIEFSCETCAEMGVTATLHLTQSEGVTYTHWDLE